MTIPQQKNKIIKNYKTIKYKRTSESEIEIEKCEFIKRKVYKADQETYYYFNCIYQRKASYLCKGNVRIRKKDLTRINDEGVCEVLKDHSTECYFNASLSDILDKDIVAVNIENLEEQLTKVQRFENAKTRIFYLN